MNYLVKKKRSDVGVTLSDPFYTESFTRIDRLFDNLFSDMFGGSPFHGMIDKAGYPKINIITKDNETIFEATVTGLKKDDITVELEGQNDESLVIKYNKSDEVKNEKENYVYKEFSNKSFCRVIPLQKGKYKTNNIEAKVENGLLTIKLPHEESKLEDNKIKKIIQIK